ncbi:hypothetical protein GCM10022223_67250 [Kineosporia mesophila]|uniref:Uncharacterized protein n=1 Tax=Kineosporia mesophila TaxID=566012 RepID=A0ABP7ASA4_9ACTN
MRQSVPAWRGCRPGRWGTPSDIARLRLHADDASVRPVFAATPAGRSIPPTAAGFLDDLAAEAVTRRRPQSRRTAPAQP